MQTIIKPNKSQWPLISKRPGINAKDLSNTVSNILSTVKKDQDKALFAMAQKYDNAKIDNLKVSEEEINSALKNIDPALKKAIDLARKNITKFHQSQIVKEEIVETTKGVTCWRKTIAIEKVGLYIPGGSAPLFSSILMLGIPAKIAQCKEIIICTPANKEGKIDNALLYTAATIGIRNIYKVGGSQAIAAMAYGTQSVPAVNKIFGPGNQYVTEAKRLIQKDGIAIDMPAGPSEVLIIADETSVPAFIAADLLAQAEHGPDSQVMLLSNKQEVIDKTLKALDVQLVNLPRQDIATRALRNSKAILLDSIQDCIAFSNEYAPEHLIIATEKLIDYIGDIQNAGSVFLGNYSCESAGDYASGTNHTLPTNGYAKNYSGVSLDSFVKKITFQRLSREGLSNIGPSIEKMASAEQLYGHKNAVTIRLEKLNEGAEAVKEQIITQA